MKNHIMLRINKAVNIICAKNVPTFFSSGQCSLSSNTDPQSKGGSKRLEEFRKKLRETTPIDDLGEQPNMHPAQKDDPLPAFPNNTNPDTGEIGGPRGPEPTRFGDWERKGRVSDF